MTAREKLAMENPEEVGTIYDGGCLGCPSDRGYLPRPDWCGTRKSPCTECWDREIPEEKKTVTDLDGTVYAQDPDKQGWTAIGQDIDGEPHILDSGDRTKFESGAVRDMRKGKGRCDLMPLDVVALFMRDNNVFNELEMFQASGDVNCLYRCLDNFSPYWDDGKTKSGEREIIMQRRCTMLLEVAKHFEEGALKYGDNNWRKGIPVRCYIDSAIRHYLKFLRGDRDEPHDRAFCWNILCCIWTCKHRPELNDYGKKDEES